MTIKYAKIIKNPFFYLAIIIFFSLILFLWKILFISLLLVLQGIIVAIQQGEDVITKPIKELLSKHNIKTIIYGKTKTWFSITFLLINSIFIFIFHVYYIKISFNDIDKNIPLILTSNEYRIVPVLEIMSFIPVIVLLFLLYDLYINIFKKYEVIYERDKKLFKYIIIYNSYLLTGSLVLLMFSIVSIAGLEAIKGSLFVDNQNKLFYYLLEKNYLGGPLLRVSSILYHFILMFLSLPLWYPIITYFIRYLTRKIVR